MVEITRAVGILKETNSKGNWIEISEHLQLELLLVLYHKEFGREAEIRLTKETASQLKEILERWLKGVI